MKKWRRGKGTTVQVSKCIVEDTWKHTHVDSQLAEVGVKLTRETQTSGDARHDNRDKMVEVTVSWCRQLQCPEADVVKRLVIDTEGLVRVLDKLVDGKSGVVGL